MTQAHLINFDFESKLANQTLAKPFPINQRYSRECLYFFLENSLESLPLFTQNPHFTIEYFGYLSQHYNINFSKKPVVKEAKDIIDWWGQINDNSKILNSKLYALDLKKQIGLAISHTQIITKKNKITPPTQSYIIQDPFGCSGLGNYFSLDDFYTRSPYEQGIFMPFVERLGDFSVSFCPKDQPFITHLLNSPQGHFQGAHVSANPENYNNKNSLNFDFELLLYYARKIEFLTKDIRDPQRLWSMDFFFYKDLETGNTQLTFSEINYRVSFGQLFRVLSKYLDNRETRNFLQIPRKNIENRGTIQQLDFLNPISCSTLLSWKKLK